MSNLLDIYSICMSIPEFGSSIAENGNSIAECVGMPRILLCWKMDFCHFGAVDSGYILVQILLSGDGSLTFRYWISKFQLHHFPFKLGLSHSKFGSVPFKFRIYEKKTDHAWVDAPRLKHDVAAKIRALETMFTKSESWMGQSGLWMGQVRIWAGNGVIYCLNFH